MNFVDTANVYSEGKSEELTGEWIKDKRQKVLLATKCRFPMGFGMTEKPGPHDIGPLAAAHPERVRGIAASASSTDHIDLYQVHMQDSTVRIEETLRALDDLVAQGKVRYIGCSNYTGYRLVESFWAAEKNHTHRYESVQLQWNARSSAAPSARSSPRAARSVLGVLVWSPLASGFLTRQVPPQPAAAGGRAPHRVEGHDEAHRRRAHRYDVIEFVEKIAKRRETTQRRSRARMAAREAGGEQRHLGRAHGRAARRQPEGARREAHRRGHQRARRRVGAGLGLPLQHDRPHQGW